MMAVRDAARRDNSRRLLSPAYLGMGKPFAYPAAYLETVQYGLQMPRVGGRCEVLKDVRGDQRCFFSAG